MRVAGAIPTRRTLRCTFGAAVDYEREDSDAMTESNPAFAHFRKSSFCAAGNCVEVAALPGDEIIVRDSKDTRPDAPRLSFTAAEWDAFVAGVVAGEFTHSALACRVPAPRRSPTSER
jgi:Domain of unknown function (DUF397)